MSIEERRRMLREKIAEQDAKRGRPLTDYEKLANLAWSLADDETEHREWRARFGITPSEDQSC